MAGELKIGIIAAVVIIMIAAVCLVVRIIFPNDWREYTKEAAEIYDVDEDLIRAVIWTESKYKADAVSPAGATGPMQLMPSTREEIIEESGIKADGSVKSEIMMGTYYLRKMLELTGNEKDALAAYNAGIGRLHEWQSGKGEMYKETKDYIKRVTIAKRVYSIF